MIADVSFEVARRTAAVRSLVMPSTSRATMARPRLTDSSRGRKAFRSDGSADARMLIVMSDMGQNPLGALPHRLHMARAARRGMSASTSLLVSSSPKIDSFALVAR